MDPAALAAALVGAQAGQLQMAIAARIMKINADQSSSIVQLLEGTTQSAGQSASLAAGIGGNVNITA